MLLEKPIGLSAAEGEQIVAEATAAGKVFGIAVQQAISGGRELLKAQTNAGALGEIYYAKAFWMRRAGIPGLGTWFTSKNLAGGGSLIDLGVHVIDMALWLMGNPTITTVSAATYSKLGPKGRGHWAGHRFQHNPDSPFEVDDLATAFLRTDNRRRDPTRDQLGVIQLAHRRPRRHPDGRRRRRRDPDPRLPEDRRTQILH